MTKGKTARPTPAPQPDQGGSYTRDAVTGELTLVERTKELEPNVAAAPTDDAPAATKE